MAELGLLEEDLAPVARGLQNRPSSGDAVMGAPGAKHDPPDDVLVWTNRGDMLEHDLARAANTRGPRPPGRRVEDDAAVLLERMGELAQSAERVRPALPGARVADAAGAEDAIHADAEARAAVQSPRGEKVLADE